MPFDDKQETGNLFIGCGAVEKVYDALGLGDVTPLIPCQDGHRVPLGGAAGVLQQPAVPRTVVAPRIVQNDACTSVFLQSHCHG